MGDLSYHVQENSFVLHLRNNEMNLVCYCQAWCLEFKAFKSWITVFLFPPLPLPSPAPPSLPPLPPFSSVSYLIAPK